MRKLDALLERAKGVTAPALPKRTVRQPRSEDPLRQRAKWRHDSAKRHADKLRRTPPWADTKAISAIYEQAQTLTELTGIPHHVDHVIPLRGKLVSGLHVETNLRVIPSHENQKKWNKFTP